ncbi:MAG TPA: glycine cleavage system aminomethyltransferase GcvT [Alphaproteobacteria bacterium]
MPNAAPTPESVPETGLARTALHALHLELGARMVPFAGYEMPVQYATGILREHLHTRSSASLFDVSHMGQALARGEGAARALEALVPGDIQALAPGRMRYTMLTTDTGGILDDLMVTATGDGLFLVLNAARKAVDLARLEAGLGGPVRVEALPDRALLALQGPGAADALARHAPDAAGLRFLGAVEMTVAGVDCLVSRSGYTGEDGFEISVAADRAEAVARTLLAEPEVAPAGLGARDTLRLEAGLCLYGHDIDRTTTPVEAGLVWSIGKRRRADGGYPGAAVVARQLAEGVRRRRVGILPDARQPAREGTEVLDKAGVAIGRLTSGGFGPTLGAPVGMGYVETPQAAPGTPLGLVVRGKTLPARIARLPFVPQRYHRG